MKTQLKKLKDQILNFDAKNITDEIREQVDGLIKQNPNSFDEKTIGKSFKPAAALVAWVRANVEFSVVLHSIAPLTQSLEKTEKSLASSEKKLNKLQDDLKVLDANVEKLRADFQVVNLEAAELKFGLDKANEVLTNAQSLIGKLGGEKGRWEAQVASIGKELQSLPNNALMAAGFATYLGSTPEDLRKSMVQDWAKQFQLPAEWSFRSFMSTESELLVLKAEGLPADDLSQENAVVILQSVTTPFIIDPSTQAGEWLTNHLKEQRLEVTTQEDQRFNNTLELAVRFGKTLVVKEIDKINPILYPLLKKDLVKQGPRFLVQVGDKAMDYHEDFRLYLVTRNPDPYLPPDVSSLINIVNFTTTRSGLEGQLLGVTIKNEKPELEAKKSESLLKEEEQKVQMSALEKSLLIELAASAGNILENKTLINSLNETKQKSMIIADSLKEAQQLQASIDKEREVYRKVASNGSALYFLIMDLVKISNMYQFSLPVFLRLFQRALKKPEKADQISVGKIYRKVRN
jgi:dynein heavy chain 2